MKDQFLRIKQYSPTNNQVTSQNDLKKLCEQKNCKLFKIESSIYFANCQIIQKKLYKACGFLNTDDLFNAQRIANMAGSSIKSETSVIDASASNQILLMKVSDSSKSNRNERAVKFVIDFSAVNYVDTNGVKILADVIDNLKKADVFVCICAPQGCFLFYCIL